MQHLSVRMRFVRAYCVAILASSAYAQTSSGFKYVNPLIGSANGGHVFAGATLPYGMAKAVADTDRDNQGGFAMDSTAVTGFSHMHDSGTGGGSSMGNFPLFVQSNCPQDDLNQCKYMINDRSIAWSRDSVKAYPGYFSVELANGVIAEMTVTSHTALYRFNFSNSAGDLKPLIAVDLTDLPKSRSKGTATVDPKTGRMSGSGTFNPSFGIGNYDLYFCADFSGASISETGVWMGTRAGTNPKTVSLTSDGINSDWTLSGGTFTKFKAPEDNSITARVGVSFISVKQACSNAEKEIPNFDFAKTLSAAEAAWDKKLRVIQVDETGIDENLLQTFWSGTYRTMISPQDYTGENPLWNSKVPYYDSYYCIWDLYRSVFPLLTILDPVILSELINSLIDIYKHEGYLPDCRMSLCKGFTQGGSNADVLIGDAYVKKVSGINWNDAYKAVVKDAEVEPLNWSVEGRGGLTSWKNLGYIPTDDFDPYGVGPHTRSISRTVEYAYNDFCIAEMAKGLGHRSDYKKYIGRSGNWQNMFLAKQTSIVHGQLTDFTGFLQPRYPNGTFGFQDPAFCSPLLNPDSCYLNPGGHETYEASIWLYTFYAPHDMATDIQLLGGPETFINRLSFLHDSSLLNIGDEQAYLAVFQFHYGGRPALSAKRSHSYIPSAFNNSTAGLPGNDDGGAMASYITLCMMGLWPVHGQDVYLITPPFFPEVNITNGFTGKTATVRNVNFDASYKAIYIQKATLNGKSYTKNWISHDFYTKGGVLELVLGKTESSWGQAVADLPPSLSSYKS